MTDMPQTDVDDPDDSHDRNRRSVDGQAAANSSASAYRGGDSEDVSRDTSCVPGEPHDDSVARDQGLTDLPPRSDEAVVPVEPQVRTEPFGVVDSVEGPVMIGSGPGDSRPGDEETFSYVDDASIDDGSSGTTGDLSREMVYVMGEPQPVGSTLPSDDTRDETPVPISNPSSGDDERSVENVDLNEDETPDHGMETIEEVDATGRLSDAVNDAVARSARRNRAFLHVDEECADEDVLLDESVLDANAIFASVDDSSGNGSSGDASGDFSRDLSYLMGEPIPAGATPASEDAAVKSDAVDESDDVVQSEAVIEPDAVIDREVVPGAESSGADDEACVDDQDELAMVEGSEFVEEETLKYDDGISSESRDDETSGVHDNDVGEGLSRDASEDISGDASYVFGGPKLVDTESPVEEAEARGRSVTAAQFSGTGDDESVGDQSHDRSMDVSRDSRHGLGKPIESSVEPAADAQANPGQWATALPGEEIAAAVANDADEFPKAGRFPGPVDDAMDQLGLREDPEIVDKSEQIEESSATAEETLAYEDDLPGESYFGDVSRDTSPSGLEEVSRDVAYVMGEPQSADATNSADYGIVEGEEEEQVAASGFDPTAQFPGADDSTSVSDFSRDVSVDIAEGSSVTVGKPLEVALNTAGVPQRKSRAWLKACVGAAVVAGGIFVAIQLGLLDIEPVTDGTDESAVTQSAGGGETARTTTSPEVPGETTAVVTSIVRASPTVDPGTTPPATTTEPAFDPDEPFFNPNAEHSPLLSDAEKPDWLKAVWVRLNDGRFDATDLMHAEATITRWLSTTPAPHLDLAERLRRLQRQISELIPSTVAQTRVGAPAVSGKPNVAFVLVSSSNVGQWLEGVQYEQRTWLERIRHDVMTGQQLGQSAPADE